MSGSTFFVSAAAVRHLKHGAQHRTRGVPSAHLSEALAAALGFTTHAALRAALGGRTTVEIPKPSNARMVERLHELGHHAIPGGARLVPEFEHSYTPFRNDPLRKKRSARWWAWRNLMVLAINAGLDQPLFGLTPTDNWWPGASPENQRCKAHVYRFLVDGRLPALVSVDANAGDELSICVLLNPRKSDIKPGWYHGLGTADAMAHGWVERRLGVWIQDGGEAFHCKRALKPQLAEMAIEPSGYADQGSFIL
jgi:hypothetical protein